MGIVGFWTPEAVQPSPFVAIEKWAIRRYRKILKNLAFEPKTIRRYRKIPGIWRFGAIFSETFSCTGLPTIARGASILFEYKEHKQGGWNWSV